MHRSLRCAVPVVAAALALGLALLMMPARIAHASVLVTAGTARAALTTNARTGTATYTEVSPIVISEGLPGDFPIVSFGTSSIAAPAGWEFRPGRLDTSTSTLTGVTSVTAEATASMITITFSAVAIPGIDTVRIAGLFARPISNEAGDGAVSGNGANGTASIAGFRGTPAVTLISTVGPGTLAAPPVFSADNLAQVVFNGGSLDQLARALTEHGAAAAWAQDARGTFRLYLVNGGFVNDAFAAAFPGGLTSVTALTVVRY